VLALAIVAPETAGACRYTAEMSGSTVSLDEDRLSAWQAFLRAHATIRAVLEDELLAERGLALTVYDVLVQLSDAPEGRLRMQELASRLLFSRSGVTRLVDRMEREDLVRREPCLDDRRGTFAVITDPGRRRLRDASGVHLRGVIEHFGSPLDDHDVVALRRAMDKVLTANEPSDGRGST
jgi:DNA-binding MarR family transcriptional regulator